MKRAVLYVFAVLFSMGAASLAAAAANPPKSPSAAPSPCNDLAHSYDFSNRIIAQIQADGLADNSAPRETNRQLKELNERQDQLVILELMKMRACPAPARSAPVSYSLSAMQCALEQTKGNFKAEICDISKWTPLQATSPAP